MAGESEQVAKTQVAKTKAAKTQVDKTTGSRMQRARESNRCERCLRISWTILPRIRIKLDNRTTGDGRSWLVIL